MSTGESRVVAVEEALGCNSIFYPGKNSINLMQLLSVSVCLSLYLSVSVVVSIFLSLYHCFLLSTSLPLSLSIFSPFFLSLSFRLSIYLSIVPSHHVPLQSPSIYIYAFVYLFIYTSSV